MQSRLKLNPKNSSNLGKLMVKIFLIISSLVLIFYFIEKINLPFPQKEIKEDVSNKIIKLR
tara:strand:+ start:208 stop:390 length:183 start_codon:yes stop_codon:yes gene_type:complete